MDDDDGDDDGSSWDEARTSAVAIARGCRGVGRIISARVVPTENNDDECECERMVGRRSPTWTNPYAVRSFSKCNVAAMMAMNIATLLIGGGTGMRFEATRLPPMMSDDYLYYF